MYVQVRSYRYVMCVCTHASACLPFGVPTYLADLVLTFDWDWPMVESPLDDGSHAILIVSWPIVPRFCFEE